MKLPRLETGAIDCLDYDFLFKIYVIVGTQSVEE